VHLTAVLYCHQDLAPERVVKSALSPNSAGFCICSRFAGFCYQELLLTVCGMLVAGRRNRTDKLLKIRAARLKVNHDDCLISITD